MIFQREVIKNSLMSQLVRIHHPYLIVHLEIDQKIAERVLIEILIAI